MSKYVGKIVKYVKENHEIVECEVVELEDGVGVSLVHADDKDRYALCIHGPLSPQFKDFNWTEGWINSCNQIMEYVKECIETNTLIYDSEVDHICIKNNVRFGDGADSSTCAFNQ